MAVYSEADREALHTQLADEAVCIGPGGIHGKLSEHAEQLISATLTSGADAIHPGFGFLSENSRFAELCEQCNITFIGPNVRSHRRAWANKSRGKEYDDQCGSPGHSGQQEAGV